MSLQTVNLPSGHALTVTAGEGESAIVIRVANPGMSTNYTAVEVSSGGSSVIGPFADNRVYSVRSMVGSVDCVVAVADPTATSAGLISSLSDETGTGAAVFATSPTLTTPTLNQPLIKEPVTAALVNGAVTISPGVVVFTKAGVAAMTLAAPTAGQEGTVIRFTSGTANAHTLTATGLIQDGVTGGAKNLATFAAFVGSSLTLCAVNLKWHVVSLNACVIS